MSWRESTRYKIGRVANWMSHLGYFVLDDTAELFFQYKHTKHQVLNKPERLRQIQDNRWKALNEDKPDLLSTTTEIRTPCVPKIPLPDYRGVRLSGVTIY